MKRLLAIALVSVSVTGTAHAAQPRLLHGKHIVTLHTSQGNIVLELDANAAPKTVANFVTLTRRRYYNDLTFHRLIPGFIIQGGDPEGNGTGGKSIYSHTFEDEINAESYDLLRKTIKNVAGGLPVPPEFADVSLKGFYEQQGYTYRSDLRSLPMVRGAIAMANYGPNTNGSQFFILLDSNHDWLDGKHTVFGKVKSGMDVVEKIATVDRDQHDKPLTPVTFIARIEPSTRDLRRRKEERRRARVIRTAP